MNTPTIRTRSRAPRTHLITGDRDHVSAALLRAHTDGRLVAITDAHELPDNQVQLTTQLHDPTPPRTRWNRAKPWLIITAKTVTILAALAGAAALVWLIVQTVLTVIAFVTTVLTWISTHLVLLGFAALVLLLAMGSAASCQGIHCRGCRR